MDHLKTKPNMLQQDFHRGSNPAYDKVAFVAEHYDELVYMYQDILEKLKTGGSSGSDETHQSSGEGLFETKEVTFIPYYIAINKDFFEDDTSILDYSKSDGVIETYNLTPKQMFGGTPEEIAKRLMSGCSFNISLTVFSHAVYTETVSRTTTRYGYNPSTHSNYEITETKEYYVFALSTPLQLVVADNVRCILKSNFYKYYQDNRLLEQLLLRDFVGSPNDAENPEEVADVNMFFFIMKKNPREHIQEPIVCNCVDMCRKYEDFTFTVVIPKDTTVMTDLAGFL